MKSIVKANYKLNYIKLIPNYKIIKNCKNGFWKISKNINKKFKS